MVLGGRGTVGQPSSSHYDIILTDHLSVSAVRGVSIMKYGDGPPCYSNGRI